MIDPNGTYRIPTGNASSPFRHIARRMHGKPIDALILDPADMTLEERAAMETVFDDIASDRTICKGTFDVDYGSSLEGDDATILKYAANEIAREKGVKPRIKRLSGNCTPSG